MADSTWPLVDSIPVTTDAPRHAALVRVSHWLITFCVLALLVSGFEITISHPRFYWGETGNVMTPALFELPIPASRPWVKTGYNFVLRDQNGWSRHLHFQAAWVTVWTGFMYVIFGLAKRHFQRNLLPGKADLTWRSLSKMISHRLRFERLEESAAGSYNTLQRLTYLFVIFVLFPLAIWTGLAMSPALVSGFPPLVTSLGGHQSARTIHFFVSLLLLLFLVIHIVMVSRTGFKNRMRAMITGRIAAGSEHV